MRRVGNDLPSRTPHFFLQGTAFKLIKAEYILLSLLCNSLHYGMILDPLKYGFLERNYIDFFWFYFHVHVCFSPFLIEQDMKGI